MRIRLDERVLVEVSRSTRRKSASIIVENGLVSALVPDNLTEDQVHALITKKRPWIIQKLHIQSNLQHPKPKEFINGETFSYLGRNYRLKLIQGELVATLKNGYLEVSIPPSRNESERSLVIRRAIIRWYRDQAHTRLHNKTNKYKQILGVEPRRIIIRDLKSRWGSCTANGYVSFNWRVIMGPSHVIDYVVAHELSHLIHHDHSEDFWRCLGKVIPDWKRDREWLRVHGMDFFSV